MKRSTQCAAAMKKADSVSRIIRKWIESKSANIKMLLYKSMEGPPLNYGVHFWSPHLKREIAELEKVQARSSKLINGLEQLHRRKDCIG